MNKFILKSILKSVSENLPKTLKFIQDILHEESQKHKDDFVFVLSSVNSELFIVPGTIDDNNTFQQKEFSINGKRHEAVKLENFIKELIEEKIK